MNAPKDFRTVEEIDQLIRSGRNLLVTGRAGTGKTCLLRALLERHADNILAVTAPTGMAAVNCEGQTLHGTFHFPVRRDVSKPTVLRKNDGWFSELEGWPPSWSRRLLFVDEVSMVRADLFEALEKILRLYGPDRGAPFGGVQIVLFGDPLQLSPIVKKHDYAWFNNRRRWESEWFFSTAAYSQNSFVVRTLERNFRQSDPEFTNLLDRFRLGMVDMFDLAFLRDLRRPLPHDPLAVHLMCRKTPVSMHNQKCLALLPGSQCVFRAETSAWNGDDPVERTILLKPGARVMLRANLDVSSGWVNGTLGTVKQIDPDTQTVVVTRDDGEEGTIGRYTWYHELTSKRRGNRQTRAAFSQMPLELAWAFTIHKMQGQTIDGPVVLYGADAFTFGQLYVGLSRVRRADQLTLANDLPIDWLRPNKTAYNFLAKQHAAG